MLQANRFEIYSGSKLYFTSKQYTAEFQLVQVYWSKFSQLCFGLHSKKIKEHNLKREFLVHRLSVMMQIGFITFDLVFWIFRNLKYCRHSFIANVISVIFVWICFQPVPNLENFEKFSVSLSEFAGLEMRHKKVEVSFELRNSLNGSPIKSGGPDNSSVSLPWWWLYFWNYSNRQYKKAFFNLFLNRICFFFQWKTK